MTHSPTQKWSSAEQLPPPILQFTANAKHATQADPLKPNAPRRVIPDPNQSVCINIKNVKDPLEFYFQRDERQQCFVIDEFIKELMGRVCGEHEALSELWTNKQHVSNLFCEYYNKNRCRFEYRGKLRMLNVHHLPQHLLKEFTESLANGIRLKGTHGLLFAVAREEKEEKHSWMSAFLLPYQLSSPDSSIEIFVSIQKKSKNKYQWFPLGGKFDAQDSSMHATARREFLEESHDFFTQRTHLLRFLDSATQFYKTISLGATKFILVPYTSHANSCLSATALEEANEKALSFAPYNHRVQQWKKTYTTPQAFEDYLSLTPQPHTDVAQYFEWISPHQQPTSTTTTTHDLSFLNNATLSDFLQRILNKLEQEPLKTELHCLWKDAEQRPQKRDRSSFQQDTCTAAKRQKTWTDCRTEGAKLEHEPL